MPVSRRRYISRFSGIIIPRRPIPSADQKAGGAHEGVPFTEAGFRQSLCVNTGYYNFLAAHTEEVCQLLGKELDGSFSIL